MQKKKKKNILELETYMRLEPLLSLLSLHSLALPNPLPIIDGGHSSSPLDHW